MTMTTNTLNVCLGHVPFPADYARHIDLMVAPKLIASAQRLAIVDDNLFGPNGGALSEYGQLIWILDHLGELTPDCAFIRIFHYRRLVAADAPTVGRRSVNLPYATTIRADELGAFDAAFDRTTQQELFNTPIGFAGKMLGQYALDHVLEDLLNFVNFLVESRILNATEAASFLSVQNHIPSCNIGVFSKDSYNWTFQILKAAAQFLHSRHFIPRSGSQRRSAGFLLERLHSFLIFKRIELGASPARFGHNVVLSDDVNVSATH
ncbi:hypothetical protein CCR94_05850 [Rhodoblastus sphagnicola]|uniref:Uncharacterized protein n=1 Tax=Rhodoblastus sphagnicola TaxID=333368 RepID=A0A2S6NCI7_9HYPH|nr:hypothetical protein [Rhodoblastus sphagnicola]MBB4199354.1 hypothetical protein [Rhodoblastus sphagnicola]PPQ32332.1 hypothetical protein CCR94_05850 [Rhodoblastus sphagnicola]